MPSLTTQCLIVYHPADGSRVLAVKAALAGLKVAAWIDVDDLEAGRYTLEQWAEAIRSHPHIFLFWSAAAARDRRLVQPQYLLALEEHGAVVPICLDETELPGPLKPCWPIRTAGALPAEALACLIEATVTGRRLLTGPRAEVVDLDWPARPGGPTEVLLLRPGQGRSVSSQQLREALVWAGQRSAGTPILLVCPYGGASGAMSGELREVLREECPPATAVVLGYDSLPYNEILDRQRVQPAGDAATAWPVTAVWAGGREWHQVDLGAPTALAHVGPRIPLFRAPGGFTFSVLAMAPSPGDPAGLSRTLAGLFALGLCGLPDGPERLDIALLLTPDAAWEGPAAGPLLCGVGGRPVRCGAVLSHAAGLYLAPGGPVPYLEDGPGLYRAVLRPEARELEQPRYRLWLPEGSLGPEEPALPLRQLVKHAVPEVLPSLPYCEAIRQALAVRYALVRQALLDGVTEERRAAILRLLRIRGENGKHPGEGLQELARTLAQLELGGRLDLSVANPRHTALWEERTHITVLQGSRSAWPSQVVADYLSRLYQQDERAEFTLYGNTVVLLEHLGNCAGVTHYQATGMDEGFAVPEELSRTAAPIGHGIRYCGLATLEDLLGLCRSEEEARNRLREVG